MIDRGAKVNQLFLFSISQARKAVKFDAPSVHEFILDKDVPVCKCLS